ncbi:iron-sulfur cluster assembly scaffold protein [Octadecabacter sp.]|nr:iron-sulfur cluster assembly scaffold protein [Octadecabacter sp.]
MTADTDLIKLYSTRILGLAADIPHCVRLDTPDASAKRRSPLCGSTVTVDLALAGDTITAFGQDVKACALGQAAAAVVGHNIVGCTQSQVQAARDQLHDMLKSGGPAPSAPFGDLVVLSPAAEHKNRHASILLAFDATLDAYADAGKAHTA